MPHALGGCRLKLERAVLHVEELNRAIQRFRGTQAHELIRDFDAEETRPSKRRGRGLRS